MSEPCCMMSAGGYGCSCHTQRMIEDAQEDAKQFGAGWLMMNPQGLLRHVSPPEICAWLDHVEKKKTI